MKSSYQHRPDEAKLLSLKGFQPDVLRLFEDILQEGASLRVRVTGRSMAPFLRGGEMLTIDQLPWHSLSIGDLILFRNKYDCPVLHRIIRIIKTENGMRSFLTKGDALRAFDEEIPCASVLGRVRRIERPLRSGKVRHVDMDSLLNRSMNFLVAGLGIFKVQAYLLLAGAVGKRT